MKEKKNRNEQDELKNEEKQESADNGQEAADGAVEEPVKPQIDIDREGMSDSDYIAALEERLGQTIAEAATCKSVAQRLQADFDNYRKRNATLAQDMKEIGESAVIEKMLTVLDNCDLARKYIQDEAALTGFNMMESQILSALDSFGLKEIEALDKEFDAKLMSAVEREKKEDKQNVVLEVHTKGYTLKGKLLRPASVKVGYWE